MSPTEPTFGSDTCESCGATIPLGRLGLCPLCLLDAELPSVWIGTHLELHELLGEGGMGAVFRATDHRLGRTVAVKLLQRDESGASDLALRLEREARVLAQLNHPGIVSLFETGLFEGQPYIVMALIEGPSLRAAPPLSHAELRTLGVELCSALGFAHDRGIVHRDIKPENILFGPDRHAVLVDFGIARNTNQGQSWTVTAHHHAVGSPLYMAPEARKGAAPSPSMDIYGLGVVLYECLTGTLPEGAFEPLPFPWDPVIRRALATDPADRYADAAALQRALLGLRFEETTAAPTEELSPDERSFISAMAALQTVASAVTIWAIYLCIMPRAIAAGEVEPLTMIPRGAPLADGRIVTVGRFVPWAVLAAVLTNAVAILGYGLLRRHWRREGLERFLPDAAVPSSRTVLMMGAVNVFGFVGRLALERSPFHELSGYIPILGGLSEAWTIYLSWLTLLTLWRCNRPIRREWRLWVGLALSAFPPLAEYVRHIQAWTP